MRTDLALGVFLGLPMMGTPGFLRRAVDGDFAAGLWLRSRRWRRRLGAGAGERAETRVTRLLPQRDDGRSLAEMMGSAAIYLRMFMTRRTNSFMG